MDLEQLKVTTEIKVLEAEIARTFYTIAECNARLPQLAERLEKLQSQAATFQPAQPV